MNNGSLDIEQKKEWAKSLYVRENITVFKVIAERVGVQARTVSKWVDTENWEKLRKNTVLTRAEQLSKMLSQLEEFNTYIESKPEGRRFADSKEADARRKLIMDIKALETNASISESISVCSSIVDWLSQTDLDRAKDVSDLFDNYIKHLLK